MRTPRFAIGLFTLAAATTVLAQTHPTGPLISADAAMRYHLSLENQVPPPRPWVAAKAVSQGASSVATAGSAESADRRLQQIVGAYSRERLHRSSWFNPWAQPPSMAPEPLTAVAPGNGVTSPGESPARPTPQTLAGQVRP